MKLVWSCAQCAFVLESVNECGGFIRACWDRWKCSEVLRETPHISPFCYPITAVFDLWPVHLNLANHCNDCCRRHTLMRRPGEPLTLTTSLFALCPATFRVPVGEYEWHWCMCVCTSCHVGMCINFMHACIAMCDYPCAIIHALFIICIHVHVLYL